MAEANMKINQEKRAGGMKQLSRQHGFSLIELLIVVAIILIIAAIAIPNLLKAKMAANEASAVSSIHAVNTAEIAYSSAFPSIGFSATLSDLGPGSGGCPNTATASCYLDAALASGTKSGYNFLYVQDTSTSPSLGYTLNVDPITPGVTGQRHFYSDQSNVTHYTLSGSASSTDSSLQ
jgi:prepilin-type N-terminal cleavage/methylation domain-containing protein